MEISQYKPDDTSHDLFLGLLRRKYGGESHSDYFLEAAGIAYDFARSSNKITFIPFGVHDGGALVAHAALIVDERLQAGDAFFGFMEFPDDRAVFEALWQALVREAKARGISVLKGPVNGSIWHQYRCIREGDETPFFKGEPRSESYYYDFFASHAPDAEISYYSAYREPFGVVLNLINTKTQGALESSGFSIQEIKETTMQHLEAIAEISRTVFSSNWGYTELSPEEFMQLYTPRALNSHLHALYVLCKEDEIIGFCSTAQENEETLLCKTIAILPHYRGFGLGNALAYRIHADAERAGYKRMMYVLIREGNNVSNFPQNAAHIFRRYAAFEFRI